MTDCARPGERQDRVVVRAVGEIDIANSSALRSRVEAASRDGRLVEVDLREVTFFDAAGMTALVLARRAAAAQGGSLVLTQVPPFLRRLLVLVGLEALLTASSEPQGQPEP